MVIFARLFGLYSFSHQSCTSSTLHLRKEIYPRKSFTNLYQLIFKRLLSNRYQVFIVLIMKKISFIAALAVLAMMSLSSCAVRFDKKAIMKEIDDLKALKDSITVIHDSISLDDFSDASPEEDSDTSSVVVDETI